MGKVLHLPGADERSALTQAQEPNCATRFKWNRDVLRWQSNLRSKKVLKYMPTANNALLLQSRLCKVRMAVKLGMWFIGWNRWQLAIDAIYPDDVPPELLLEVSHVVLGSNAKQIPCKVYKYHVGSSGEIRLFLLPTWRGYREFKKFVNTDLHRLIYTEMDCVGLLLPQCCKRHEPRYLAYYRNE